MSYSLLIVDDQKKIREGLRTMIEQMQLPFDRIELAGNGKEASAKLRQNDFDVVMVDIRMPIMDGLELMAEARAIGLETLFIVVSGYDDFSYAQKAMEYGAIAYLLKPVSSAELKMRLEQIQQTLEEHEKTRSSSKQLARHEADSRRRVLQLFARSGAGDALPLQEIQTNNPDLWSAYRLYRMVPVRLEKSSSQTEALQTTRYILNALESLCSLEDHCVLETSPHLLVAISDNYVAMDLLRSLHEKTIFGASCVSHKAEEIMDLPSLFADIDLLFRYTYLFPEKEILQMSLLQDLETDWILPLEQIREIFHLLGYEATYPLTEALSQLFRKNVLRRYTIDYFEVLVDTVVNRLEEYERVILPWVGKDRLDLPGIRNPYSFPNIRSYLDELQRQFLHLNSHYYERSFSYNNAEPLRDAITFIQRNYYKDIDLASVANHVHLNYAYFSSVFKKNIGKSFSDYLRDVRIDGSQRLLLETDDKITEIAKRVGFDSYRSFVRSFKEVTGQPASEYRKLHQETKPEVLHDR